MEVNKELLRAKFKAYVALVGIAEDMVSDKELIERQKLEKEGKAPKLTTDEYCTMVANKNKCPFLRADYKCNIYENRPDICRK